MGKVCQKVCQTNESERPITEFYHQILRAVNMQQTAYVGVALLKIPPNTPLAVFADPQGALLGMGGENG